MGKQKIQAESKRKMQEITTHFQRQIEHVARETRDQVVNNIADAKSNKKVGGYHQNENGERIKTGSSGLYGKMLKNGCGGGAQYYEQNRAEKARLVDNDQLDQRIRQSKTVPERMMLNDNGFCGRTD